MRFFTTVLVLIGAATGCTKTAPLAPMGQSGECQSEVHIAHSQSRPVGLDRYYHPLQVQYALDSEDNVVFGWENPNQERQVGSCMTGLFGIEPAVWIQPDTFVLRLEPGEHVLYVDHSLTLPVGGYPGAYSYRLQTRRTFRVGCDETTTFTVFPDQKARPAWRE
jgi:hypothetical protein